MMEKQRVRPVGARVTRGELIESGVLSGLIGGVLMALVAMVRSAAAGGDFFGPVYLIAATILGGDALQGGFGVLLVGLLVHLTIAAALGVLFTVVVPARTTAGDALLAGLLFGAVVFLGMTYIFMPLVNPVMDAAMRTQLTWFFVYHLVFGAGVAFAPAIARSLHVRHQRAAVAH